MLLEKLGFILDSMADKTRRELSFDFNRGDREKIIKSLEDFFDQWPMEEAKQDRFVCQLCELITTRRLKNLLMEGPNVEKYYKTLTKLAGVYSLFSTGVKLPPQDYRRFGKYFNETYPLRGHVGQAKLKIFMSCQFVLKNLLEGNTMPFVYFKYGSEIQKGYSFDGLAWTIISDGGRRITAVKAYRLSEEKSDKPKPSHASEPLHFEYPWDDERYEWAKVPRDDMEYWKNRFNEHLAKVTHLIYNPPTSDVAEKIISDVTYAASCFHLWGYKTENLLSFQAKILSNILGVKPPSTSCNLYKQVLVHSESSFFSEVYHPSVMGQTVPELPEHLVYDTNREIHVGDFRNRISPSIFSKLPKWVEKDYEEAFKTFQRFEKAEDSQKALVDVQQWISKLVKERKDSQDSPYLVMHFVVSPLFQSILEHLEGQNEDGLDFLNWYVASLEPYNIDKGYGNSDQTFFALYAHMTALCAKERLSHYNTKGMNLGEWRDFIDWVGFQRNLLAWLTRTKSSDSFGKSRGRGYPYNLLKMSSSTLATPFSNLYSDWKEKHTQSYERFVERMNQEPKLPDTTISIPKNGKLEDINAYIFEGLAWIPRSKGTKFHAVVLDDFDQNKKPIVGTAIIYGAVGNPMYWRHGDPTYWEEPSHNLMNQVLCETKPEELESKLGHLCHTHAQYVRFLRGSAAVSLWLDVALRMLKGLPQSNALKNIDCYALSISTQDFLKNVYLKREKLKSRL
jgi:hypothetical protein